MISIKLLCNFIEITPPRGCSHVNLLHIFRTHFYKIIFWGMLLRMKKLFSKVGNPIRISEPLFPIVIVYWKTLKKHGTLTWIGLILLLPDMQLDINFCKLSFIKFWLVRINLDWSNKIFNCANKSRLHQTSFYWWKIFDSS